MRVQLRLLNKQNDINAMNITKIKELIDNNVDCIFGKRKNRDDEDIENMTPLMVACVYGNFELVKFLVEKGADINMKVPTEDGGSSDSIISMTSRSMKYKNVDKLKILKYLFDLGVYVNQDILDECLDMAVGPETETDINVVEFLISKGAKGIKEPGFGNFSETLLNRAVGYNLSLELFKLLVKVYTKDDISETLKLIKKYYTNREAIRQFLEQALKEKTGFFG